MNLLLQIALSRLQIDSYSRPYHIIVSNSTSHFPYPEQPIIFTLLIILSITVTLSNGAVLLLYITKRKVRKTASIFIINLVVADFQNGIISLPLTAALVATQTASGYTTIPVGLCIFMTSFPNSLVMVTFISIVLVSVERFLSIMIPLHYHRIITTRTSGIAISITWFLGIVFSFLPTLGISRDSRCAVKCDETYPFSAAYIYFVLYGIICLPMILVVIMYAAMYRIAKRHLAQIAKLDHLAQLRTMKESRTLINSSKAARTTFIMFIVFALCWLPSVITIQIFLVCNDCTRDCHLNHRALDVGLNVATTLTFSNSALNPLIYSFRNPVLKQYLRALVCCRCRRNHRIGSSDIGIRSIDRNLSES